MKTTEIRGHAAMLAANFMWGLISPVAKFIFLASAITPMMLVEMRMVGAAVLMWAVSLLMPPEHVPHHDLLKLFFASLLGVVFNQGVFTLGVSMTSPVDASVITTSTPIFTMVIAALYIGEPVTAKKVSGVAVGAAGALLLILSNGSADAAAGGNVWGDILCIAAEACFACYLVFFKSLTGRYTPVTLMKWMFTYAAVCTIPFTYTDIAAFDWGRVDDSVWAGVAYTVVCATFLCYLLVPVGQRHLRPTVVSMYCYVQPVVASCIVAVYWGTSTFTPVKVAAIVLVFAGVYLVTRSKSKAEMDAYKAARHDGSRADTH